MKRALIKTFLFFIVFSISSIYSNVEVYVRNRCGESINFKVYLRGAFNDEEEKDIKDGENRTLFRKDRFRICKFHVSKRKSGPDPQAKWEKEYYVDEKLVNKIRFQVTGKNGKAKDFKKGKEAWVEVTVYLRNGGTYVATYKKKLS